MPDAIITSTESTFGTISGTFAADQSTVTGTIAGVITGTLTGSVGVPGPAGPQGPQGEPGEGVPAGGLAGQFLQKTTTGVDYATDWVTVNLGNYLVKSNNLSDLTDVALARDNLQLGTLNTPTFAGVNVPGSGTSVANLGATFLTLNQQGHGQFTIQPSQGIVFPDTSVQTTAFPAGSDMPMGGTTGQVLTKQSNGNYDADWQTISTTTSWGSIIGTLSNQTDLQSALNAKYDASNPSGFITASALSPYLTSATASATYQTLSGMADYLSKAGNLAGLASTSTARTNLGLGSIAVVNDAPSDGSQYARKDAAWSVVIPGDRYLTTSTTSNTIGNGTKSFTIGTGLSYTPTQNITISYDSSNHMHGEVLTYNSGTGALSVDVNNHTGSGTYASWVINVGGVTPATSVAWGSITGTLSAQTDLQSALDGKYSTTNPAGYITSAALSPYLLSSTAASTYYPLTNPAGYITSSALAGYATESWVTSQGYITSAALSPYLTSATAASTYQTIAGMSDYLAKSGNLAGLTNLTTARSNLGLGTMATATASDYLTKSGNLSGLANPALARNNLSLGTSDNPSFRSVNMETGQEAIGYTWTTAQVTGVNNAPSISFFNGSYINIGSEEEPLMGTSSSASFTVNKNGLSLISYPTWDGSNYYGNTFTYDALTGEFIIEKITQDVGAGSVSLSPENGITISPAVGGGAPIIISQSTGITFTDSTTQTTAFPGFAGIATESYVSGQLASYAPLASPTFTGTPSLPTGTTAVTQSLGDNSTKVATTAFVIANAGGGGGGSAVDIQVFGDATTSGTFTWTKPAGAIWVEYLLVGGGGGGGSGARQATTSNRCGGGGGAGGGANWGKIGADALDATETVVVGAGGTGGASRTIDTFNGAAGGTGGQSTFKYWTAGQAPGGSGGATATSAGGGAVRWTKILSQSTSFGAGGNGSTGTGAGGASILEQFLTAAGGGGGAGAGANVTTGTNGGAGGLHTAQPAQPSIITTVAGGAGGVSLTLVQAGNGVSAPAGLYFRGATGGGGGYYRTGQAGGTGGNGGFPGGAGGGGGASDNGSNSGAGGTGGNGFVVIVTYLG